MSASKSSRPAGFWVRVVAHIVDQIVAAIVMGVISFAGGILAAKNGIDLNNPMALGAPLVLSLAYVVVLMFVFGWCNKNKGGTPGKLLMGLRLEVVATQETIGYVWTFIRILAYLVTTVFTFGLAALVVAFRKDKRGLHDLLLGTQVIQK